MAAAVSRRQCKASAVTMQSLSCKSSMSERTAAASLPLGPHIGQRHARLRAPGTDHQCWHVALAALVGAAQGLAVQCDHPFGPCELQVGAEGLHETLKRPLEPLGVEHT